MDQARTRTWKWKRWMDGWMDGWMDWMGEEARGGQPRSFFSVSPPYLAVRRVQAEVGAQALDACVCLCVRGEEEVMRGGSCAAIECALSSSPSSLHQPSPSGPIRSGLSASAYVLNKEAVDRAGAAAGAAAAWWEG